MSRCHGDGDVADMSTSEWRTVVVVVVGVVDAVASHLKSGLST